MSFVSSKDIATAFLTAHFAGDAAKATALCAPDFESVVFAPIEIFPHMGQKKGLGWIEQSIRLQQKRYSHRQFTLESALGDGDQAALVARIRLTKRSDGRVIDFVSVHIFTLRDGLIARHREMFDSFHMVEQLLGVDLSAEFADRLSRAV